MSIEKLDTVKLKQEKIPYTMHLNYVLQNVKDHLALAIWCYLTSLPDDWHVHRNQLMDHFDIGRDKLGKALKYLNVNKLIEYVQEKTHDGQFHVSQIIVKCGIEFEILNKSRVIHNNATAPLKTRSTDFPLSGETAATKEINNKKEIKEKKGFVDLKRKSPEERRQEPPRRAAPKQSSFADPTKQSTSYKSPEEPTPSNPEAVRAAMMALPRHMRPKRFRNSDTHVQ